MAARALERLETLLTGIYDLDIGCRVEDFLVTDRRRCPASAATRRATSSSSWRGRRRTLHVALPRRRRCSSGSSATTRATALDAENLADCWTALEGISHFLCVAHNAGHDRPVSRLALEMQAEIDKYVACFALLRRHAAAPLPGRAAHAPVPPHARRPGARRPATSPSTAARAAQAARFCARLEPRLRALCRPRGRRLARANSGGSTA